MCQLSPSNKYENIFEIQIISPFMYLSRLVCWNTHIYNINDFLLRMFEEFSHSIENPWIRSSSNSFKGEWKLLFFRFYPSFCKYFQLPSCFYLSKALSLENFRKIKLFLATSGPPRQARQARFGPCLDFGFQYTLIRNNRSKKFGVEYWTLLGRNSPWRTLGSFENFGLEIQNWESTSSLISKVVIN